MRTQFRKTLSQFRGRVNLQAEKNPGYNLDKNNCKKQYCGGPR